MKIENVEDVMALCNKGWMDMNGNVDEDVLEEDSLFLITLSSKFPSSSFQSWQLFILIIFMTIVIIDSVCITCPAWRYTWMPTVAKCGLSNILILLFDQALTQY